MNTQNTPPQSSSPSPLSPAPSTPPTTGQPYGGIGKLIFRVTTASGAIPLEGAKVIVRERRGEGDPQRGNAVSVQYSDRRGKTTAIDLPTVAKALSMSPSPNGTPPPFACYDAEITLEGFFAMNFVCIPIFDGITSIQPADLIPLPENGRQDGVTPDGTMIIEGENPNL